MKSFALRLAESYYAQHESERQAVERHFAANGRQVGGWADIERTFANWLNCFEKDPDGATAVGKASWCGKVTRAFFSLYAEKPPRLKPDIVKRAVELYLGHKQ